MAVGVDTVGRWCISLCDVGVGGVAVGVGSVSIFM
jgi:hypothetical protein